MSKARINVHFNDMPDVIARGSRAAHLAGDFEGPCFVDK